MDPENYKIDSGILPEDKDNLIAELARIKKYLMILSREILTCHMLTPEIQWKY